MYFRSDAWSEKCKSATARVNPSKASLSPGSRAAGDGGVLHGGLRGAAFLVQGEEGVRAGEGFVQICRPAGLEVRILVEVEITHN